MARQHIAEDQIIPALSLSALSRLSTKLVPKTVPFLF